MYNITFRERWPSSMYTVERRFSERQSTETGVGICRHVAKSGDKDRTARDSGDKAL